MLEAGLDRRQLGSSPGELRRQADDDRLELEEVMAEGPGDPASHGGRGLKRRRGRGRRTVVDPPPGALAGVAWVGDAPQVMFEEKRRVTKDGEIKEVSDMVLRPLTKDGAGPPTSTMAETWGPVRVITAETGLPYVMRSLDVYRFGGGESPLFSAPHLFGDEIPRVLDLRLDGPGRIYAFFSHSKTRSRGGGRGRGAAPLALGEARFVATTGATKPHRVFDWDYSGPPETTTRDLVIDDSGDVSRAGAVLLTQSKRAEVVTTQLLRFDNAGALVRTIERSDIKASRDVQIELLDDGSLLLLTLEGAPEEAQPPKEGNARLLVWGPLGDEAASHELGLGEGAHLNKGRLHACANRAWMLVSSGVEDDGGAVETYEVGVSGFGDATPRWEGAAEGAGRGPNGYHVSCRGPRILLGLDYRDRVVVVDG